MWIRGRWLVLAGAMVLSGGVSAYVVHLADQTVPSSRIGTPSPEPTRDGGPLQANASPYLRFLDLPPGLLVFPVPPQTRGSDSIGPPLGGCIR